MNPLKPLKPVAAVPPAVSWSPSRRGLLATALTLSAAAGAGGALCLALPGQSRAAVGRRALYHLTPRSGWACDAQRPYYLGGELHLPHLQAQEVAGPGGWRLATSTDEVAFTDRGDIIPLEGDFPAWSGSAVVDVDNTAGFGAGAVVALVTRLPGNDMTHQAQYLHWSTDEGRSFSRLEEPVIPNTDALSATTSEEIDNARWFRDPKIVRDEQRGRWVCVIGRACYLSFYVSTDLRHWQWVSNFDYLTPESGNGFLGGMECPDLFEMTADDGTSAWVLAASMDGWEHGGLGTYAYWVGSWDGERFVTDNLVPQWLDHGFDWYAAVTWPSADEPRTVRHAIGWLNNWKYAARHVPTMDTDSYNGQYSIVREVRMRHEPGGWYCLVSMPISALRHRLPRELEYEDLVLDDSMAVLPWSGQAYDLELDIDWDSATNAGVCVARSADGRRHTNIGVCDGEVYVDRGPSERPAVPFAPYTRAHAPIDPQSRHVYLRILVDRGSVEVFVNGGHTVMSNQLYLEEGDTGLALYADGGTATFSSMTLRTAWPLRAVHTNTNGDVS
ncbi:MAG: glycoside hydrolase family 32 protein [Actinomyces sp.]|uniref:glycoside hydrolase family 32 protein n=1 Tax=Actinomyces sp. TaxID=29317 RepID=UPI0026DBFE5D|nr:glycoside hydrolase family 32 protein [Actinomyces sp.]MDO4244166.1 glycoside hydrolase family 32 protein [Actinomyces sp.]